MFRHWPSVAVVVVLLILAAIILIPAINRHRLDTSKLEALDHVRQLGGFAQLYGQAKGKPDTGTPVVIPPGTIFNVELKPDERLSWLASMLPFLDTKNDKPSAWAVKLDTKIAWNHGSNVDVGFERLRVVLLPGAVPTWPAGVSAPTQIVGLTGVGPESPLMDLAMGVPPRAGCFRYDAPTPLKLISQGDGTSNTILFLDVSGDIGPWIRGGTSTTRWLDDAEGAKPYFGPGGQFGGNYPNATLLGKADGAAEFRRNNTDPAIIKAMSTIAAGDGLGNVVE
jgi:hypothetical protein